MHISAAALQVLQVWPHRLTGKCGACCVCIYCMYLLQLQSASLCL